MQRLFLRQLYRHALSGLPGLGTPMEMADRHRQPGKPLNVQADEMARVYTATAGTSGFATGLPGFFALPITLPIDLIGMSLLHLHMSAALASLAGADPNDPEVRKRCIASVVGKPVREVQTDAQEEAAENEHGARSLGIRLAGRSVRFMAERVWKFGAKQAVRRVPIIGGVIGAATEVASARRVARDTRRTFASLPQ
jgi:hypothetical protein